MKKIGYIDYLDTGIFPATVLFAYNVSLTELRKELRKQKCNDWLNGLTNDSYEEKDKRVYHREVNGKKLFYLIFNQKFTFSDYDYCLLAHEVVHLCQFIMPHILDRNQECEAEAYTHTHLMAQCLKIIRNTDKK